MTFGEKVQKARIEAGLSQYQLCRRTGISRRALINYEKGAVQPKSRETYHKLAEALNIDVNILLDDNAEFVLNAVEKYGSRGYRQAKKLTEEVTALYAGGELEQEDMDAMMRAIQDAYWIAKEKNRKYTPKKYRTEEQGSKVEDGE